MNRSRQIRHRSLLLATAIIILVLCSRLIQADTGSCGGASTTLPFTDVPSSNIFFCAIAQAYFTGLTNGSSATTYSPSINVSREQMAAFITRTQDSALKRGSRRAALQHWWTPGVAGVLRSTSITGPGAMTSDGEDVWVISNGSSVKRVHASDGRILGTWTATGARDLIAAAGRIFVAGSTGLSTPGKIYVINPDAPPGPAAVFEDDIGIGPLHITFDGVNLWTANHGNNLFTGSISRVNVATGVDSTFSTGFNLTEDILWDGANLWVTDSGDDQLKRVDPSNGSVLENIPVGDTPNRLLFDGTNIWVTNFDGQSITIVRAMGGLRGTVVHTITGNGLSFPQQMAFDGERVLVGNNGDIVCLFKAADFTPLGSLFTGTQTQPVSLCSDGLNFWITRLTGDIVRFD
jgi:YVTN family beta-propeller protein